MPKCRTRKKSTFAKWIQWSAPIFATLGRFVNVFFLLLSFVPRDALFLCTHVLIIIYIISANKFMRDYLIARVQKLLVHNKKWDETKVRDDVLSLIHCNSSLYLRQLMDRLFLMSHQQIAKTVFSSVFKLFKSQFLPIVGCTNYSVVSKSTIEKKCLVYRFIWLGFWRLI